MANLRSLAYVPVPSGDGSSIGGRNPTVSADGRRIALQNTDGPSDIIVKTPETGAVTRIAKVPGAAADDTGLKLIRPALSGDGETVVFAAEDLDGGGRGGVYAFDLNTGRTIQVPDGDVDSSGGDLAPDTNANGLIVAFAKQDNLTVSSLEAAPAGRMTPDTRVARGVAPDLTADGREVAVSQLFFGPARSDIVTSVANAVLLDRASGRTERLDGHGVQTDTAILDPVDTRQPAVSADGRFIAYARDKGTGDVAVARDKGTGDYEIVVQDRATDRIEVIAPTRRDGDRPSVRRDPPDIAIDDAGRRIAFSSFNADIVAGDSNGVEDVFVYDRITNAVTRVSETPGGTGGNGASNDPEISGDGRTVVFESRATNLRPGDDDSGVDVYRAQLDAPDPAASGPPSPVADQARLRADETLTLDVLANDRDPDGTALDLSEASVQSGPVEVTVTGDDRLTIAADGEGSGPATVSYTVVDSSGRTATSDVAVDVQPVDGVAVESVTDAGVDAGDVVALALDRDGTRIAFASDAPDLVPNDTNDARDVFVLDRSDGSLVRASETSAGTGPASGVGKIDVSADGTAVVFTSEAGNLVNGDTNGARDVFRKDLASGALTRVSVGTDGQQADAGAGAPAVSGDGSVVAFASEADTLTPDDDNGETDVFVRDTRDGTLTRISDGATGAGFRGGAVEISADGRFVAYFDETSGADAGNIVLYDRATETRERFAPDVRAIQIGPSGLALSADGGTIGFTETETATAIDVDTGTRTPIAARPDGFEARYNTLGLDLAADGARAVFRSDATGLVPGDGNLARDAFVRDLANPDVEALDMPRMPGAAEAVAVAISGNGEVAALAREPDDGGSGRLLVATLADHDDARVANGLPHATDATLSPGGGGQPVTTTLDSHVSDPDGDDLGFAIARAPANGTASVAADGTLSYTPDASGGMGDSFRYRVTDGNGGTDTATVTVREAAAETPELPTAAARVFLAGDGGIRLFDAADVFGGPDGDEHVFLAANTVGADLDANVERLDIDRSFDSLSFAVTADGLTMSDDGTVVARVPSLNQDLALRFADGSARLSQQGPMAYDLTGGAGGTAGIGPDGGDLDAVTLGGATAAPPQPDGTSPAATIFVEAGRSVTVADPVRVVGHTGSDETVVLADSADGIMLDANIEQIEVSRNLSELTFEATGAGLDIRAGGATLVTMPSLNQDAELALESGTATLTQTGSESFVLTPADGAPVEIGTTPITPGTDADAMTAADDADPATVDATAGLTAMADDPLQLA